MPVEYLTEVHEQHYGRYVGNRPPSNSPAIFTWMMRIVPSCESVVEIITA